MIVSKLGRRSGRSRLKILVNKSVKSKAKDLNIIPYYFITVKVRIETVVIEPIIAIKIYKKHRVTTKEIKLVLKENAPIFRKAGGKRYMAIGLFHRYLTIFFTYDSKLKTAYVQTAYPSVRWQIRLYRRKK